MNLRKEENIRFAEKHNIPSDADYDMDNWFARAKRNENGTRARHPLYYMPIDMRCRNAPPSTRNEKWF